MLSRVLVLLGLAGLCLAQVPLPSSPDWTSSDNDFSTGGAFADINGDGRLDLCVSNGNDMANDRNAVYLNSGGALETVASWRSQDRGMFGHCYAGDVDNDGRPDLAVACLGPDSSASRLVARLYRNCGTVLDSAPVWRAADRHSSFDCCLGDFDLDGDLDLAISTGDAYRGERDAPVIYRNSGGSFDTLPCWTGAVDTAADAIRFCDIDNDGDLDLFLGQRRKVTMYRNNGGALDSIPSWSARAGWVLRLAFGDYDRDGWPDLAVASNGQLGDENGVRVFRNLAGQLDTTACRFLLGNEDRTSCVAWGDVDGDGFPELAAGGWWEPLVVFENDSGTLGNSPAWTWYGGQLVCETVAWADVDNSHLDSRSDRFSGDGTRRLFSFSRTPVQFLDSVLVEGAAVPPAGWCWDPLGGWLSFAEPPPPGTENVTLHYRHSEQLDLCVTNWEQAPGNHLFLNNSPSAVTGPPGPPRLARLDARPNPFTGTTTISLQPAGGGPERVAIHDAAGRLVRVLAVSRVPSAAGSVQWDGRDDTGHHLAPGAYFVTAVGSRPARLVLTRR